MPTRYSPSKLDNLEKAVKALTEKQRTQKQPSDEELLEAWLEQIWQPFEARLIEERKHVLVLEESMGVLLDGVPQSIEFIRFGLKTVEGRFFKMQPQMQFRSFDQRLFRRAGEVRFAYQDHLWMARVNDDWEDRYRQYRCQSDPEVPIELKAGTGCPDLNQFCEADPLSVDPGWFWCLMTLLRSNGGTLRGLSQEEAAPFEQIREEYLYERYRKTTNQAGTLCNDKQVGDLPNSRYIATVS